MLKGERGARLPEGEHKSGCGEVADSYTLGAQTNQRPWPNKESIMTDTIAPLTTVAFGSSPSASDMLAVLKLFLIPVGGGIPAGVLLAKARCLPWIATALTYLFSDIILALAFEPVLRGIAFICGRISFLQRFGTALKTATARNVEHFGGAGAGPVALLMISFGVDPMTGRASALAAGHGFLAGWAFAIAGDMLYFAVIAFTTLRLNAYISNPDATMVIVLLAMFCLPPLVRRIRPFFFSRA